jgi:hypothetical protein
MKKLLLLLAIGYGVWNYYLKPSDIPVITNIASDGSLLSSPTISNARTESPALTSAPMTTTTTARAPLASSSYKCDGRKYCSQMTSCAEATYFLQHCPGVKMDGGNGDGKPDGVPCEAQLCGR